MATHVPGTANADDVPRLAECARAFERKLQGIEHDLDPEWREALRPTWPFLEGLPAGAPFRHEATGWVPMQWACAGYFDWAALLVSGDGVLRRIARLSLPRRLLRRVQELRPVPAQLSSRRALAALAEAGVAWPC